MNATQFEILNDLVKDVMGLVQEADESFLVYNERFSAQVANIDEICTLLILSAYNDELTEVEVVKYLSEISKTIMNYRDSYAECDTEFKEQAYVSMNSFFDKIFETLTDFIETL